ncbi:uncharacterized protein LOC141724589 isoform X2 [Apium graveolens]|uniref:uncharacterized protein LOC141724589 isoform X2 n=1 Tax=Apium graveolens TaxID=4045 RepID=UPI003D7B6466
MSSSSQPPTSLYLSRDHSETLTRALLRLAAGKMMISMLIQHSYITFSKEEEVIRCIQSVHGFVLEGNFLRASFGTAKYCHAWLRNMLEKLSTCRWSSSLTRMDNMGPNC